MSAHVSLAPVDYNLWFRNQQYGPGAYPTIDTLTFLCHEDATIYNARIRFQEETMRVHETVAPTTATAYDITDLSRHVIGYWEMMLSVAKADPVWAASYGGTNTPRSFNSSWSRAKQHIRELIIKNQRAADQAAADAADDIWEVDEEGEEASDEEIDDSIVVAEDNDDGEDGTDEVMDEDDEDDEGEDSDEEMNEDGQGEEDSDEVIDDNDEEELGFYEGLDERFWWDVI
ncbi:hypothetical protein BOTCAL_0811g00030 [Botryotinia calthae]|uniref:Uncharacterized protein n=1 Tax=Botryotinia calthae TaxID=38488 RepID=A0A4Y8CGQ3_9HELO|nr:hypothetical protein BOTCAL_0811g00030 [Botryotinia calthae]